MVLLDSAIIELSSLTASVTLVVYVRSSSSLDGQRGRGLVTYMSWLGFFFFLRMAVAVSSSSFLSAPEASLSSVSR